jgi:NlpC/P60 family putative phage cell wall peptidase
METEVISRGGAESRSNSRIVIPGLVPGSHFPEAEQASRVSGKWMAGTSPAMTVDEVNSDSASPRLRVKSSADAERIVASARTWIGTPYVHQASVKGAGCDCLGLLRGVWRELRGAEPLAMPNYSPDWAEATGVETLYTALARILHPVAPHEIAPGDIALFRMSPRGPAKHCGIVAPRNGALTLIHARQNKRVSEEPFSPLWRRKLAYAFRL